MVRGPQRSILTRFMARSISRQAASNASGSQRRLDFRTGVEEPILIRLAPWRGAVEPRHRDEPGNRTARRAPAGLLPTTAARIAEIAAETEYRVACQLLFGDMLDRDFPRSPGCPEPARSACGWRLSLCESPAKTGAKRLGDLKRQRFDQVTPASSDDPLDLGEGDAVMHGVVDASPSASAVP